MNFEAVGDREEIFGRSWWRGRFTSRVSPLAVLPSGEQNVLTKHRRRGWWCEERGAKGEGSGWDI